MSDKTDDEILEELDAMAGWTKISTHDLAELRAELKRVKAENTRLGEEASGCLRAHNAMVGQRDSWKRRAEKAEADNVALREGLLKLIQRCESANVSFLYTDAEALLADSGPGAKILSVYKAAVSHTPEFYDEIELHDVADAVRGVAVLLWASFIGSIYYSTKGGDAK
jgi:hypothetical protein